MVLEGLGKSLRNVLGRVGHASSVDDELINDICKDLQRALLEADVNVKLVLELTNRVKDRAKNEAPPAGKSIKQHLMRIIYEELVRLVDNGEGLQMKPQTIMMVGLYGQGKTTTTGKLALYFSKKGFSVGLIGADIYRPAALDQLKQLGEKVGVEVYGEPGEKDAALIVQHGIAAAVKGTARIDIIDKFADTIRREWNACGLKKGYMYMADCVTDPRWQRTFGTFGEDPELIEEIFDHLIPGIQGGSNGVTPEGVSMTVKHFPGGGARENGFDPHYAAGQWNIYATPGSLQKYHIPAFRAAIRHNAESIMPYYSKPSAEKSAPQEDFNGNPIELQPYGFAYNKVFIDGLLRGQMGFRGYINSDTGIVHNMCWGVDMLDEPERIGYAVTQSGVDLISGLLDNELGEESYARGTNDYYDTHAVPAGFKKEDLVLTDASLNRAVSRTLTELFRQGMFEDTYADPKKAAEVVATKADWEEASRVHRESVVLLKNDGPLPLKDGTKVYAEAFGKSAEAGEAATKALREMLGNVTLVDTPDAAQVALLMVSPQSGAYFNATPGYLELDICEDKTVCNVDESGKPTTETHKETTLVGANRLAGIAAAVHAHGGKVVSNINCPLAWEVGNVEKVSDALTVGFDTYPSATLDVMFGRFAPVGKLPLTLPKGDEVLAVNADGVCISPNDVPGFAKDAYMPDSMKDENGKAYAYRDAAGNYYEMNFGLTF